MKTAQIRQELTDKVRLIEPIGKKLKFKLDEEVFLIDGTGDTNTVTDLDEDADCTIIMSADTYLKLRRKEINPMMATITGKIKVKGDIGLVQKLKQLM